MKMQQRCPDKAILRSSRKPAIQLNSSKKQLNNARNTHTAITKHYTITLMIKNTSKHEIKVTN